MSRRLVILTAVALEARAVATLWRLPSPLPARPARVEIGNVGVEIHLIGIRAIGLPNNLASPIPTAIIMAGLAGALDPALAIGDLVLDECPPKYVPDIPLRRGKIHTSADLVGTPAAKQALIDQTAALAVDMESAAVREVCQRVGVPIICLRSISDTAADGLDPALLNIVDSYGRPRPMAIAATLLRRPALVPHLRQLGSNANRAAASLAMAVKAVVDRIAAIPDDVVNLSSVEHEKA